MASDEAYADFLDKANRDPNDGVPAKKSSASAKGGVKTNENVPQVLRKAVVGRDYVSDSDEEFEGVSLAVEGGAGGGLVDEETFAHLTAADASGVSIMDIGEWDVRGEYKDLVDAVREAIAGGDVRVYRVQREGARVEYWVLGWSRKEERLVGVKALAIES